MSCLFRLINVAVKTPERLENVEIFKFKNEIFTKLFDFCTDTLIKDIKSDSEFSLKIVEDDDKEYLSIFLEICNEKLYRRSFSSRMRLLTLCGVNMQDPETFVDPEKMETDYDDSVAEKLYDLLRETHKNSNLKDINVPELESLLKPTLRPYQVKAVKWLINQETRCKELVQNYKEIFFLNFPNHKFFLNSINLNVTTEIPKAILPQAGILADEMGLGKTIEMLSLILLRKKENYVKNSINLSEDDADEPTAKKVKPNLNNELFCICTKKTKNKTISCAKCGVVQHIKCVRKYSDELDQHICPSCWSSTTKLITSRATVIVTPTTIKRQWYLEINKHVKSPLKILMYCGIGSSWISPKEIADYDIILTDYNILRREIHFAADKKEKKLRSSQKYMRMTSPLLNVLWYRVCLDEAQMVESANSFAAKMVKLLPTVHRWAVTGTPIQKNLDDLRGLLEFLDMYPFYEKTTWNNLVLKFYNEDTSPLLNILNCIMWRSCKKSVINELNIPIQLEEMHYIKFSDAEKLFYSNEHLICAQNFNEKVCKLIGSLNSQSIFKLDAYTLKKILEPLRKLRQNCSVPILLQKYERSLVKKVLQPQELLDHLKSTNEIECKSQIRQMASNYNGLAAIYMIREDYEEAIKMYDGVISLAKEFSGNLSVDSLLQIHALHNMLIAHQLKNSVNVDLNAIRNQQHELEWKYINSYYKNYITSLEICKKMENSYEELMRKISSKSIEESFFDIIEKISALNLSEILLTKINEETQSYFNTVLNHHLGSIKKLEMYMYNWFTKMVLQRTKVLEEYKSFKEIISLIKPKENLNPIVSQFIKTVFNCHLKVIRGENDDEEDDENRPNCDLCKAKFSLANYECLIFDKHLDEKTKNADGTWNPSIEENVLKIILSFSKNKNIDILLLQECEKTLAIIDSIKKEYKELVKLWIEIEYIAKAYDELEMCKMRLTTIETSNENQKNAIYQILIYQVDEYFQELTGQLESSKQDFYRKLARLKYIRHLEQNSKPDNCPICKTDPDTKYCVLECGHTMCICCFSEMSKYHKSKISCAICRASIKNVYYVTCKPPAAENEITIKGEYSSKIEKILSTILKLKSIDNKVKILIFSHWTAILQIISKALVENEIEHRLMWSTKSIDEFKNENLNINCMLLLLAHGSKGLNLIESTHVILVEPILNIAEELQAISRVHRIGQTKITTIHRFIVNDTIEEKIFDTMSRLKSLDYKHLTVDNLAKFFSEEVHENI